MNQPSNENKFVNIEAEKSLLGFLLLNNDAFDNIFNIINTNNFYLEIHKNIFNIIKSLLNDGKLADPITVSNASSYVEKYKDITLEYLLELTNSVITLGSYTDYANLIYDLYLKRQIIELQNRITTYLGNETDAASQLENIQSDFFKLAEQGSLSKGYDDFETSLQKAYTLIEASRKNRGGIPGISTGLIDLDKKIGGLQNSDLIVLAGRPSMGKTALAVNIAFSAALNSLLGEKHKGAAVAIFSLEMSADQLAMRILSSEISKSSDELRRGILTDAEFNRLNMAVEKLKTTPLFIDDTPSISIAGLRSKCRKLKRQHQIGLVVIDYIQLIGNDRSGKQDSRATEVGEITRGLKGLAKELNVPVLALSQLSRAVESRDDKKPMLSDLRESGSIEQDADVVAFIFREEYYLARSEPKENKQEWEQKLAQVKDQATVIIAKNRHGAIGNVDLKFIPDKTQFANIDKVHIVKP
ncbi:Replicative DNA helicase [Candidatus Hepatincola sp. Av]